MSTSSFAFAFSLDDETIMSWNNKCVDVLQYSSEEALQSKWPELLLPEEWRLQLLEWIDEAVDHQSPSINLPLVAKNGERCVSKMVLHMEAKHAVWFCAGHTPLGQCPNNAGENLTTLRNAFPIIEREVADAGIATFSSQEFNAGDILFEEEPFVTRIKPADVQKRKDWNASWVSAFDAIKAPMCFPGGSEKNESMLYASMALVRDALTFAKLPGKTKIAVLRLASPPLHLANGLVSIARQIAELCNEKLKECQCIDVDTLQKAILTFEVNTFPGGRMFWSMSRINHSCAPNALFVTFAGKHYLKALRRIEVGEEISISYFNEELLYPTYQRQWLLWRSKCFLCQCTRCAKNIDTLRCRPCAHCTTRGLMYEQWKVVHSPGAFCRASPSTKANFKGFMKTGSLVHVSGEETNTEEGRWLRLQGEDTSWMLIHGEKLGLGELISPVVTSPVIAKEDSRPGLLCGQHWDFTRDCLPLIDDLDGRWYDRESLGSLKIPNARSLATSAPENGRDAYMDFLDGCWKCSTCGLVENSKAILETERRLSHLAQYTFQIDMSAQRKITTPDGSAAFVDDMFVAKALSLADDILAVCGPRHWAWKWGLVFLIDFELSLLYYCTGTFRNMWERIIDNILDVWDWLETLDITHDPSYYLRSRALKALKIGAGDSPSFLELQRRVDSATPFADCLGQRSFLPASRVSGA